ncbi:MAG: hypothetical protein Q9209_003401 [Squamulea sp. 1 TL-2023]
MLKGTAPIAVLFALSSLRLESPNLSKLLNLSIIVFGIVLASLGEIHFQISGFLFQMSAVVFEAYRLAFIQKLLKDDKYKMDPLVSLYFFAPCCAGMICVMGLIGEWPGIRWEEIQAVGAEIWILNGVVAMGLNVAGVLLIGKTSSLVLTLCGVLKNITLIGASMILWGTVVTPIQFVGNGIAMTGLVYYNLGGEKVLEVARKVTARLCELYIRTSYGGRIAIADIFTNTRELWHPPGARGVYGGAVIAQCLSAAQQTIPPPSSVNGNAVFLIHSMHCYFVLAGDSAIPILYHVERVRDGKSFMTRTVQARQKGRCIFTTTLSFVREGSAGKATINHAYDMPKDALAKLNKALAEESPNGDANAEGLGVQGSGPFITKRLDIENRELKDFPPYSPVNESPDLCGSRFVYKHSLQEDPAMGQSPRPYFIGTVALVHNLLRFSSPNEEKDQGKIKDHPMAKIEEEENSDADKQQPRASIGIMVSLDHTIYFHRPREIKADEWLLSENESPWSGDGRGLVFQKIWNKEGKLVASCVQEGLVRLAQDQSVKLKL